MPFPTTVDTIVDAPPFSANTLGHASQVLGPQRITVGPTMYNVKSDQYGAKGDGSTDDTVAIQAALDAARTAGGGIVGAPGGTYMLSLRSHPSNSASSYTGCIFPGSNTILTGAGGRDVTVFKLIASQSTGWDTNAGGNNAAMIFNFNLNFSGVAGDKNIVYQDFTVDGNGANQTHVCWGALQWRTQHSKFFRVRATNLKSLGTSGTNESAGLVAELGTDISFESCECVTTIASNEGSIGAQTCSGVTFYNCRVSNTGTATGSGIGISTCRDVRFIGCHAYQNFNGFNVEVSDDVTFTDCHAGGITTVNATQAPWAAANVTIGNLNHGFLLNGLSAHGSRYNTLINCTSRYNGAAGVRYQFVDYVRIVGGDFSNNSTYGIDNTASDGSIGTAVGPRVLGSPILLNNTTAMTSGGGTNVTKYPGLVTAPTVPASGTEFFNPFPFDATVYLAVGAGGTITLVQVNLDSVLPNGITVPTPVRVPASSSIRVFWATTIPTWTWVLD